MAGADRDLVVSLDVGASGIAVAVLDPLAGPGQELAGVGFSPAVGFDKGVVTDMDDAVGSVRRAVADAELAAGVNISFINLCVDMPGMLVCHGTGEAGIRGRQGLTRRQLLEVQKDIYNRVLPTGYAVLQLAGLRCYVDGKPHDRPLGARGREFKLEVDIVAADGTVMEQIHRCFTGAGLKIKQTVAGPLAAAEAALDGVERKLGTVLVDMGAGMTRAAYINHDAICEMRVFPVGAEHITSDLALILHTNLEEAERIKLAYGLGAVDDSVSVQPLSGEGARNVPGQLARRVIRSRVEEILEFLNNFIKGLQLTATLPGGVVLTGGGALLTGLPGVAAEHLAMPVRVGSSRVVPGGVPEQELYRYTNAVGLCLWAARQLPAGRGAKGKPGEGIMDRILNWLH